MNIAIAIFYDILAHCLEFEDMFNRIHKQRITKAKHFLYLKTGIEI